MDRLMNTLKVLAVICITVTLSSCWSEKTSDPDKAFKFWTSIPLKNTEVDVLHGRYWRSPHFTLEYEAIFKMIASKEWVNQLIELNSLEPSSSEKQYMPTPFDMEGYPITWFSPSSDYTMYSMQDDRSSELYLWVHINSDTIYIFDRQL